MNVNKIIFIILALVFAGILLFLLVVRLTHDSDDSVNQDRGKNPQNIPIIVLRTDPINGQQDIYPGEIKINISLNREIFSKNDIVIKISPEPTAGFEFTNSFPSKELTLQIFGGMAQSTTHTLTVSDTSGNTLYTWFFTTSNKSPESSSAEVNKIQQQTIRNYYPLFDFVPYKTDLYTIDYTDRLTLEVKINGTRSPQIEASVENWIKSKGIDPSTHTIDYISQ